MKRSKLVRVGLFDAIVLGLVQALTEFLPISSSAHISIVGQILGNEDPGAAFTAITQIGTEIAVLVYFRRDIARIISHWFKALPIGPWKNQLPKTDPDARMGWFVILGSVPIVAMGLLFQDQIETVFRNLWLMAVMLIVFGLLLGFADYIGKQNRTLDQLTLKHGLIFGLAQAAALVPGVSRSGGTITAGMMMGYTREAAARYSFLLAIPAVLGSGFYQLYSAGLDVGAVGIGPTLAATVVAFAVGYVVIIGFLKLISTSTYWWFVFYRIALAIVVMVLLGMGVLTP